MSTLRFAVAGSPLSTPRPGGTVEGLKTAKRLGIDAMEIEWVQNVPRDTRRMEEIRETAGELDIVLTVHAPYYVNLNALEKAKLAASKKRILAALAMGELASVRSVCVHAAFYLGMEPTKAYRNVHHAIEGILRHKKKHFPHVNLALETMGRTTQFGSLEEVLAISREFDLYPCLDPAHLHARTNGGFNTAAEWHAMFDAYEKALGKEALQHVHMHYSGIAYGPKGEKHHLPLTESDARWKDFLNVLKERKIGGVCVCESPLLERDTLLMKHTYTKLR